MSSSFIQLQMSSDVVSTVQSTNARASQRKGTGEGDGGLVWLREVKRAGDGRCWRVGVTSHRPVEENDADQRSGAREREALKNERIACGEGRGGVSGVGLRV